MPRPSSWLPLVTLLILMPPALAHAAGSIRVITDRTPSHLEPLFAQYEQGTGQRIETLFVDDGLMARLGSRPTEADLVITATADLLEHAAGQGWLAALPASVIARVPEPFLDPDGRYAILSYRARALFLSRERVPPGQIHGFDDLVSPELRGRVCMRSARHRYNVSLFAQMVADRGLARTRRFLAGLAGNLARPPTGNDRAQVRGIRDGVCDVAIANSYYMGIMLSREDQRAWGRSAYVVFPDQDGEGAYVLTSGAALTRATRTGPAAAALFDFLVGDYAQTFFARATYEYPVIPGIDLPEANQALGRTQPQVEAGRFRPRVVPLARVQAARPQVVRLLDELGLD